MVHIVDGSLLMLQEHICFCICMWPHWGTYQVDLWVGHRSSFLLESALREFVLSPALFRFKKANMPTSPYACVCVVIHAYIHACMHACLLTYILTYLYTYIYLHTYILTDIHTGIQTYILTYIQTYI